MKNYQKLGDLYALLEVRPNASKEVIHGAWRGLMQKYHPDKTNNDDLAARLNQAKSILTSAKQRQQYDKYLESKFDGTIGNYKVIDQIGEGGFGRTYKAKHTTLEELACLKQNINITPIDTELLTAEAKVLWNISHYSLPTLRDFFQAEDGSCILAMTYVEGVSLDKIIQKQQKIDPEHVCWMSQRLLNALHYLHYHGIVHCDVKPNNIIIKPEEHNAVLVDYGFASVRPKYITKANGFTEIFAAPEILQLKPPLPESDLYSLGLTAMYALGGNPLQKKFPKSIPYQIKDFFNAFLDPNPLKRPSWENTDLVKQLSNIRQEVFGRKSSKKKFEV